MKLMRAAVRELFCELADISQEEREQILAKRRIPADLRAEVESLLGYDSTSGISLGGRVSEVAQEALRADGGPLALDCGPYRLIELLGSGGMGAVYLAERRDGEIEHKVAIKLLRADVDRPAWRDRFLRERQLLAYLNHPSIARLLDAGHTTDGRPYLVMEHVDGSAIDEYAASLDLRARLKLFLQVCDGVSHAHRRLIIHRDLKPSNILVDSSGHPKLLDFGIAKLLDVAPDQTQTVERFLTPNYASPEQLRGDIQTTATDIYSLGAVLYKLLIGRPPREQAGAQVTRLPKDIHHILRKALREEPDERYASVDALAGDLGAFLESRPVQARSGDAWYRARKFARRYWAPASATLVTVAGLSLGLYVANHERALHERRFQQVRQLANKVLALDDVVGSLPGSTKARHQIIAMSKEYLEGLTPNARDDRDLALELGVAYARLGRAQGVPGVQNLGQHAQAGESLKKAEALIEPVLADSPHNRQALLALSGVHQGLMTLAQQTRHSDDALTHARKSAALLDTLLGMGKPSEAETREAARLLYSFGLAHRNLHLHEDATHYLRRSTELARSLPRRDENLVNALSLLADLTRISANLEGALELIREARAILNEVEFSNAQRRRNSGFMVLWREGVILAGRNGPSLNRTDEAVTVFQQALDMLEEASRSDPNDASVRILFDQTARELGDLLRDRDPQRALAVYDQALHRLGEVRNNPRARSGEAGMLAGSSYVLRRLNRIGESKGRIDHAFRILREINEYPVHRINADSEVEPALRALADHHAATGRPQHAVEVYQELLDRMEALNLDAATDLRYATKVSRIYEALAGLYRRTRQFEQAEAFSARRTELWQQWDRKLPDNIYVRRQLQTAGVSLNSSGTM